MHYKFIGLYSFVSANSPIIEVSAEKMQIRTLIRFFLVKVSTFNFSVDSLRIGEYPDTKRLDPNIYLIL